MPKENTSDSSTSDSEVSACSSSFNPLKALYSKKTPVPVKNAPLYENVKQFESALKNSLQNFNVIPVGNKELIKKRQEEKETKKKIEEQELLERNKQRFAQYEGLMPTRRPWKTRNILTRMENFLGPLQSLKECVDMRLRVKIITRSGHCVRGEMQATLIAFDKQWNMALCDVIEIWTKKKVSKRKVPPPSLGTPVAKGTAAKISPVPEVIEKPIGNGLWECSRHVPQLMVRGEHIVLVSIMER